METITTNKIRKDIPISVFTVSKSILGIASGAISGLSFLFFPPAIW